MHTNPLFEVTLSREELLAITQLGKIRNFPELGEDPIENLSPEQKAIGLIYAERALRARGLARISEKGHLEIIDNLLKMIWVCGNPNTLAVVTTIRDKIAYRSYLYRHEDLTVLYFPDTVLHRLVSFKSLADALENINELINWPDIENKASEVSVFRITDSLLREIQRLEDSDKKETTYRLLTKTNIDIEDAKKFSEFMSQPLTYTVFQMLKPISLETVARRDLTILHNENEMWTMIENPPSQDKEMLYTIGSTTKKDIQALISKWLEK